MDVSGWLPREEKPMKAPEVEVVKDHSTDCYMVKLCVWDVDEEIGNLKKRGLIIRVPEEKLVEVAEMCQYPERRLE